MEDKKLEEEKDMTPILIEDLGTEYPTENSKQKSHYGLFKCQYCDKEYKTILSCVRRGESRSCGCLLGTTKKHGLSRHRLYDVWKHMIERCHNIKHKQYVDYGGRGIKVCEEWHDIRNFVKDMYPTYKEGLSLDRIDNNKGYSPDNCRWADAITQSMNKRLSKSNTTGYRGVQVRGKGYRVRITNKGKLFNVGSFKTLEEAVEARNKFIIENDLPHIMYVEQGL